MSTTNSRTSSSIQPASFPADDDHSGTHPTRDGRRLDRVGARSPLLPWMDWRFSLIFPVALILLFAAMLFDIGADEPLYTVTISSSTDGSVPQGATVLIGTNLYAVDERGEVAVTRPEAGTAILVSAPGFRPMAATMTGDPTGLEAVQLQPATVVGVLTDKRTGDPIAGATITLTDGQGSTISTTNSDDEGAYRFADVPSGAELTIDAGSYGTQTVALGDEERRDFAFELTEARGLVLDSDGEPLQGAVIHAGESSEVTGQDGRFAIDGVAEGAIVSVSASGFESTEATVENGQIADIRLVERQIKGIYANSSLLGTPGGLDELIEIANTTEINAIVIDVKQDTVYYDSQVPFFNDAGTVSPIMDINDVVARLRENDIYAIARIVVFQDPLVAEARPDLAVGDVNGGLWVNEMGVAWVNAFHEELWDANIELAREVVEVGFDEVQYDYVRFPSDGDLTTAEFGQEYTGQAREDAITEFMKRSHEAVNDAGGKLAADLFGFITIVDEEQYIGQRFSRLEPYLDYVCMMIYPSHFTEGNIASAPGHPNDYPYETIFESLQRAEQIVPGSAAKFRPWLQDFSYGYNDLRDYDADDVRAQIDAAEEFGASGWMLWGDPFNVTVEALEPDPGARRSEPDQ